jgi:hypothetical protein
VWRQKSNARRRQELQAVDAALSLLLSVKKVAFFATPAGNLEKDNSSIIKTNFFIRGQTYTACTAVEIPKTVKMYHRIWGRCTIHHSSYSIFPPHAPCSLVAGKYG